MHWGVFLVLGKVGDIISAHRGHHYCFENPQCTDDKPPMH